MQTDDLRKLAAAGDVDAQWALLTQGSDQDRPTEPEGLRSLPLAPAQRRLLKNLPRSMPEVDAALRDVFGRLVRGKAPWPLLLFGAVGTGKTRGALALCDVVFEAPKDPESCIDCFRVPNPAYMTLENLCTAVIRNRDTDEWRHVNEGILLVLDEIGSRANIGDLQCSTLQRVLDVREQQHNRVGIYISNLSPSQLAGLYDDRIMSRLTCGTVFKLSGPDRRQRS